MNLEIHRKLLAVNLQKTNRFELQTVLQDTYNQIAPKAEQLNVAYDYFRTLKYSLYRGWLRQKSIDSVMSDFNTLIEKRLGNRISNTTTKI